ncbi:MAG: class I SAM-dependent methyltransferase [Oxalicibacterium faecigallinarum]|uniref:class I SAM-dependent methyltransferase n=1 Tax=Oxalicibacterium faecigallinarum TaxID=573741 RepID=UPI0028099DCA|nr:class I SAM-dependent methyltransferase [Oxalicibacterium faecigallinarum]MDQ7970177.1 class I SAM-dependent methyltransferase [Oxalicibacterium faecigallinarum]
MSKTSHWDKVYSEKAPDTVSWYAPHLDKSLALIERTAESKDAAIIDVGGGEATLIDDLLARGYRDLSMLDISQAAIDGCKKRLGDAADRISWLAADITQVELPAQRYDIWHDRAVFHFLTEAWQREAYVRQVIRAMKPGGNVIVATFGPEGPLSCSGLETVRYDSDGLHGEFGERFKLVESAIELHATPFGSTQQFLYCYCKVA